MCTNGVNNAQLLQMIQQLDDHIALERRWMHKLAHIAEDGGYENAHEKMHEAQALLDNVRALLDEGVWDAVRKLVPEESYAVIQRKYS